MQIGQGVLFNKSSTSSISYLLPAGSKIWDSQFLCKWVMPLLQQREHPSSHNVVPAHQTHSVIAEKIDMQVQGVDGLQGGRGGQGLGGGQGGCGGRGERCFTARRILFLRTICISVICSSISAALLLISKSLCKSQLVLLALIYSIAYCIFSPSAFIIWLNAISSIAIDVKIAFIACSRVNIASELGNSGIDILF